MNEVFVIEKMVVVGLWELMSDTFFTDEKKALDVCLDVTLKMQKMDKSFSARVTKLTKSEDKIISNQPNP